MSVRNSVVLFQKRKGNNVSCQRNDSSNKQKQRPDLCLETFIPKKKCIEINYKYFN